MFQTFTGSSRKPRQVNLGGPKNNPFAKASALQNAQQERENRQRERDRLKAARILQNLWRGRISRQRTRDQWRQEFDSTEGENLNGAEAQYESQEDALVQLQRLLQICRVASASNDLVRIHRYLTRLRSTLNSEDVICAGGPWPLAYLRLQRLLLSLIRASNAVDADIVLYLLIVKLASRQVPELAGGNARQVYSAMARVLEANEKQLHNEETILSTITDILLAPLSSSVHDRKASYEALAGEFLVSKSAISPPFFQKWFNRLADGIDPTELASAVVTALSALGRDGYPQLHTPSKRYNLLGTFIYLHRLAHRRRNSNVATSHKDFVHAISSLLLSLASELSTLESFVNSPRFANATDSNKFANEQILTLVDQESIRTLLNGATYSAAGSAEINSEAKQLATYALTLLRFFPRRADEIRMWLYLGSTGEVGSSSLPAIKFFWKAARSSTVFGQIMADDKAVVRLAKAQNVESSHSEEWVQDDWRIILIFLELYTFVLKLMDDEEFFSASSLTTNSSASSWARASSLPFEDVKDLTLFLKNLAFRLYFNAKDIVGSDDGSNNSTDTSRLSSYFRVNASEAESTSQETAPKEVALAGLSGISIDYVKGLVTGMLRMVHERDSRRKFLPKDHWLMTAQFSMDSFIGDVVAEEENRRSLVSEEQELDTTAGDFLSEDDEDAYVGTSRDRSIRHQQRLERQQQIVSRKRYLQAVAPRSEILQNMPFFIPFNTRVQIFREFVHRDQFRRRNGLVEDELWRINMANAMMPGSHHNNLAKHTATVRRGHEFEDALDQFYSLGEGLKEPIQISFMDQFGQQEAGIDGGGVTKEFLTSVTSEAFTPHDGLNLFKENEQRLLYPNPTAMEEQKETLRQAGIRERTPEWHKHMQNLLKKYEFLGRIIGKCLYEGILVDINFAPFFLLKWALTGGDGAAARESAYRASINDLRDIDQDLYRGLITLKNYPGNVEEDMALDFTIDDTFTTNEVSGQTKTITKELRPDGAKMSVTNENRLVYISYVARHRLVTQPSAQTNAFLKGLSSMISPSWLSMVNQSELQTLISGTSSQISIEDLRKNTAYGGLYTIGDDRLEHPTVQLFWRVMESLDDADRRKVLKFVTSTPRAPLLGFGSLNPKFSIRDSGAGEEEYRLPSTSTCVNLLKLPRYKDEKTLREKLLYAVNSGAGFDLS